MSWGRSSTAMKKKRKRKNPDQVPFNRNGNMMRTAEAGHPRSRSGKDTFLAALALADHWKYGSSRRLKMVDTATGTTYPIFETDFLNMCKDVTMVSGEVLGEWGFCKKSTFYGIYLIQEITED